MERIVIEYGEMNNEELNTLSYERFFNPSEHCSPPYVHRGPIWEPCNPDSNQAERYLFPQFRGKCNIVFHYSMGSVEFMSPPRPRWDILEKVPDYHLTDEHINRTKVIACLESDDKLKGEE